MTEVPEPTRRPSQAVLLVNDSTLRGYTRLSLLMADIPTTVETAENFFENIEVGSVSVVVIDRDHEARLLSASSGDPLLLRRTVLLDPGGAPSLSRERLQFFAVLQRVDAENIVRSVRGCMATTPVTAREVVEPVPPLTVEPAPVRELVESDLPPAPAPPVATALAETEAEPVTPPPPPRAAAPATAAKPEPRPTPRLKARAKPKRRR